MDSGEARVSGIILAAGGSTRLGRPKQLLPLGGEPLLRHTVRTALSSKLAEVILVLGHQPEAVAAAVGALGQRTVVNPSYAAGQSTSLITGLDTVAPGADGALVLLGDQPEVQTSVIDALIDAFSEGGAEIVVPAYGDATSHPVLFSRELFTELRGVRGDVGARDVIRRHRNGRRIVHVPGDGPPPDIDTEEAYQALLARYQSSAR